MRELTLYNIWATHDDDPLPFRIVPAPAERDWIDQAGGWPYKCLPLRLAAETGWALLSPVQFTCVWDGSPGKRGVTLVYERGKHFNCIASDFGLGVVTFNFPYLFRTAPGTDLWVHGPANFFRDGMQAMEGIVETDWAHAKFTMNWKLTRPGRQVRFRIGDPICVLTPVARDYLRQFAPRIRALQSNVRLHREYNQWKEARRAHIDEKAAGERHPKAWQKDYYRGLDARGEVVNGHRTRVHLASFQAEGEIGSEPG
jgi:hypothetical protein